MEKSRASVRSSGTATAHSGAVAISGIQVGDNYLAGTPVARSAYLQQVRRIAPATLAGRDAELAELAEFCTRETGPEWVWWQAPAWSGKSALLAWAVLNPPPGVRVVSFFITARWFGNGDRAAFLDVVLEQLAEVAGRPLPAFLTDANREAHFQGFLEEAAHACQAAGERLVLVVDGLDEDRGVTTDPDSHSIAALLPGRPPGGTRVVVAGRGNPPVPGDVPEDHPLRDPGIIRPLSPSPVATVIKDEAKRELTRLLRGTPAEQRLLGTVTAAGGGLSGRDLAELTGLPLWEVTELLETVSGRTFAPREGEWSGATLYVLAHEELQVLATERLGDDRLAEHRERIHAWAEEYREREWPDGTPEYLLRGYFPLLRATHGLERMIPWCLDSVRQDRLMDLSGGDHIALAEIAATLEALANREPPDLLAACRLAIRRDHLRRRGSAIPVKLPALWAALGDVNRAETIAHSFTRPDEQVQALAELAGRLWEAGDPDRCRANLHEAKAIAHSITSSGSKIWALAGLLRRAVESDVDFGRELFAEVEAVARSFPRPDDQDQMIAELADAMTALGDLRRAETLIRSITEPDRRAEPLAELGLVMIRTGDMTRARELAQEAEVAARTSGHDTDALALSAVIWSEAGDPERGRRLTGEAKAPDGSPTSPSQEALRVAMLAGTVADAGDLDRARELAEEAETLIRALSKRYEYPYVTSELSRVLITLGEVRHAETLIRSITEPYYRAWPLAELGLAMIKSGDATRARELAQEAETLARSDLDPHEQPTARLATVMARAREPDRARAFARKAGSLARAITDPDARARALTDLAQAAATVGDLDGARTLVEEAETAVRLVAIPGHRDWRRSDLSAVMGRVGDLGRAAGLARSIAEAGEQADALTHVARAAAQAGDQSFARGLAAEVEGLAPSVTPEHTRSWTLRQLAGVLAEADDVDRAETVARSITDPTARTTAFVELSRIVAGAGDLGRAEALARSIDWPHMRAAALAEFAEAAAEAGEPDRAVELAAEAEAIARSITDPEARADALTRLAEIVADPDRARALAESAETTAQSITFPHLQDGIRARLAGVMARAGDRHGAETLARSVLDADDRSEALAELAVTAARAGDIDHAESLVGSVIDPEDQAKVLAEMAASSTPDRARRYLVRALSLAEWTVALDALAETDPAVLDEIADDFLAES